MGEVLITRRPDPHAELGYECPECKAWSPVSMWKATEVGREACGDHAAMQCPLCGVSTDTVFTDFEEPDHFLEAEARKAGRPPGMPTPVEQVQHLKLFLAAADDRLRKAQAEAAAAKREAADMRAAWLRAVGGRLLFRPDLLVALEETTTDMRLHLDELAEVDARAELVAMEAEYGPHVSIVIEEDA